jgi:hypothetical protein
MSSVQVYISDNAVLIVPLAKRNEFCAQGGIEPGKKISKPISYRVLGKEVLEAVDISSRSLAISMKDIVWVEGKPTGIKSPRTFSKKYRNIYIKINNSYKIAEAKRNHNGDYIMTKDDPVITLALSPSEEELGRAIMECLELSKEKEPNDLRSFTLNNGEILKYQAPSDNFEDIGDGHTDAYQIFTWGGGKDSYIGFLFARYNHMNNRGIEEVWKDYYKIKGSVRFRKTEEKLFLYEASYEDEEQSIKSSLFLEGNEWRECLMRIDKMNCTKAEGAAIKSEYSRIVKSCQLATEQK